MKCSNIKRNIPAYIDKELAEDETVKVKEHLEQCADCRKEFEKLNSLNEDIVSVYKKVEISEIFREKLIDNVYDSINKNTVPHEAHVYPNKNTRFKEKSKNKFLSIYGEKIKGGIAAILILCAITVVITNRDFFSDAFSRKAQSGMYLVEKHYTTLEKAEANVKDIPFVVPTYVPQGYGLKDVMYYKSSEASSGVELLYIDKSYNELHISYYQKGESFDDDIMNINYNSIKIETSESMGVPKPTSKATKNMPMTQKSMKIDLQKYGFTARIDYNSKISDTDKTGDSDLVKIADGYLSSQICNLSTDYKGKSEYETTSYTSYEALKKSLPSGVKIVEPSYLPKDFKLKQIIYKKVFNDFFIIDSAYENSDRTALLFIDYRLSGKGWVNKNANGKIDTSDAYLLAISEGTEGKAKFLPKYVQKTTTFSHPNFDLNMFLQYDARNEKLNSQGDNELKKVLDSIVNK